MNALETWKGWVAAGCPADAPRVPVPLEALAEQVRADGELEESEALALLDELALTRKTRLAPFGENRRDCFSNRPGPKDCQGDGWYGCRKCARWWPELGEVIP